MPDKKKIPGADWEYADFLDWYKKTYGTSASQLAFSPSNYKSTLYYARYIAEGAPSHYTQYPKYAPGPRGTDILGRELAAWYQRGTTPPPAYPPSSSPVNQEFASWYGQNYPGIPPGLYNETQTGYTGTGPDGRGAGQPPPMPQGVPSWPIGPEMDPIGGQASGQFQAWMGMGQFGPEGAWSVPDASAQQLFSGIYDNPGAIPSMYHGPEWQIKQITKGYDELGQPITAFAVLPNPAYAGQQRQEAEAKRRWEQEFGLSRQEFELKQQQMQQQEAQTKAKLDIEKQQYLAQLAAQPQSWLQYNAAAGTPPTIQPWMQPLMPSGYDIQAPGGHLDTNTYTVGAPSPLNARGPSDTAAGQPIPGFAPLPFTSGDTTYWRTPYLSQPGNTSIYGGVVAGGTPDYSKLPQLGQMGRAYWEGMGPTGQSQYLGYEKARTGAPPLETLWRLPWEQTKRALPSSGGMSLSYRR